MKIKTCHKNCITLIADMKIQQGTISDQSDLEQSEERRE